MPSSRGRLIDDSAAAWTALRSLPWRARWTDNAWREPFQLMAGAAIYLGNALRVLPDAEFHLPVRPQRTVGSLLRRRRLPRFGRERQVRTDFAKMHLASASLRLPAAVYLRGRLVNDPQVRALMKHDDLDRAALEPHLGNAPGCCLQSPGAVPTFEVSLALLVAHRDEFAHGEIGQGIAGWRQLRTQVLTASHRCRIAQAQLTIIQWLIGKLT